ASSELHDGNFSNGEQYIATSTFLKGTHEYYFAASDGESAVRLPESGTLTFESGYSNVAFLPGLGVSRMYRPGVFGQDRLWEPNGLNDIDQLTFSSDTRASQFADIYTHDVIDQTLLQVDNWPGTNAYKEFIEFMDDEVAGEGKSINEWKALSYDWRMMLGDLLQKGTITGTENGKDKVLYFQQTDEPYILEELRRLAETSATGKVTLITHSNGGLLAKYLLKELENPAHPYHDVLGKMDKLILVASPQVGTPEAIASLLHGTTNIAKGTAREFAESIPATYHLLPSSGYFTTVETPVIEFSDEITNVEELSDLAGTSITTASALRDFMTGREGKWADPKSDDIDTPNVVDPFFLDYAENVHTTLTSWIPPEGFEVVQIAGWGVDTVRGISYDDCDTPFCADTLEHLDRALEQTIDGDGTVVVPSALWMATSTPDVERWWVDLFKHNNLFQAFFNRDRNHASILEVDELQIFLKGVITGDRVVDDGGIIVSSQPAGGTQKRLRFTLHSPVELHLYDGMGRHTGLILNPDPTSDIHLYEKQIPNSYYREFGEVKYAGANTATTTTVFLRGEALSSFTFSIDEIQGNDVVATSTAFINIPVTASTTAAMVIPAGGISSLPPELVIDVDGDGTDDLMLEGSEEGISAADLLTILKGIVKTLDLPDNKEKKLLKSIGKVEKELAKEHKNKKVEKQKTKQAFKDLLEVIKRFEKKGVLTAEEAEELREVITRIRDKTSV
ncbi:MAG: hypothetical protein AAB581_03550, partial [Patescibacteria group bacterium]